MQIFDITIAANQARQLEAPGTYFYFYSGSAGGADSTIVLKEDAKGTTVQLKPGQAFRLPAGSRQATRWSIQNFANAGTITGLVVIGDGEITDNRVTGVVEVVDGELQKSKAGQAFSFGVGLGPIAANFCVLELWNPAGSGKRGILSDVLFSSGVASVYALQRTAALAFAAASAPSKSSGGAGSVLRVGGSQVGAVAGTNLEQILTSANLPLPRLFKQPYTVEPGTGILVACNQVNVSMYATIQFTEEAV